MVNISTQLLLLYIPLLFLLLYLNHIILYESYYLFIHYYYYHTLSAISLYFIKDYTIIILFAINLSHMALQSASIHSRMEERDLI